MAHLIKNCLFSFSKFQNCLDNFVSCLYFSLHKDSNDFCILSYVCLSHGWCKFSFINYALCKAFTVSGKVLALSAVAKFSVVSITSSRVKECFILEWFYYPCLKTTSSPLLMQLYLIRMVRLLKILLWLWLGGKFLSGNRRKLHGGLKQITTRCLLCLVNALQ